MTTNKKDRTIESILDLNTGKEIIADSFFQLGEDVVFQFRYELKQKLEKIQQITCAIFASNQSKLGGKLIQKK